MPEREYEFRGHPYKIVCVEQDGFQHPSWFSFEDESSVRAALWDIRQDDVVFDIGAAYGSYTLTALACGAKAAYAWSPPQSDPPEPDLFEKSLRLNGWSTKCYVYRRGLYDRAGWLNAMTQEFTEAKPDVLTVDHIRVDTLDGSIPRVEKIDWMKLDVEGAEVEVLKGARETIAKFRPRIVVENHLFKRASLGAEVRTFLEGQGYTHKSTTPYHSVSHSLYLP